MSKFTLQLSYEMYEHLLRSKLKITKQDVSLHKTQSLNTKK